MKTFKNKVFSYSILWSIRPLLLYLLIMIIYFLLFIYFFADPVLCQDNQYDMKISLVIEMHRYRTCSINYEMIVDTYNLMQRRSVLDRDFNAELEFLRTSRTLINDLSNSLGRISQMVSNIRALDPTFQSPIQAINYLRVAR